MRFASYQAGGGERAAVQFGNAAYDVEALGAAADVRVPPALHDFIREGALERFRAAVGRLGSALPVPPLANPRLVCPLRRPRRFGASASTTARMPRTSGWRCPTNRHRL